MTTVVIAENRVVTDSLATQGDFIVSYDFVKARIVGDYIVTGAGRASSLVKFFTWVEDTLLHETLQDTHPYASVNFPEDMVENDFIGAILCPDGVVVIHEGGGAKLIKQQPVILGSGDYFATAALDAGATPERAVEIATLRDVFSGGEVVTYQIEETAPIPPLVKEDLNKLTKKQLIDMLTETGIE
tara:strand:+ start:82709 stop:83266 length:558 start_codon:yes stop_codon:yes gene_type:complete